MAPVCHGEVPCGQWRRDAQENVNIAALPENEPLVKDLSAMADAGWRAALPPR